MSLPPNSLLMAFASFDLTNWPNVRDAGRARFSKVIDDFCRAVLSVSSPSSSFDSS